MKINLGTTTDNAILDSMATSASRGKGPTASRSADPGEAAVVSLGSGSVDQLRQSLQDVPAVRNDRVQALQASMQQGTYSVDPPQLANAMFQNLFGQ